LPEEDTVELHLSAR